MEASKQVEAPDDEAGTGTPYGDLVQEADVPRVGDEGVEGVDVAGKQLKAEESSSSEKAAPASHSTKAKASE